MENEHQIRELIEINRGLQERILGLRYQMQVLIEDNNALKDELIRRKEIKTAVRTHPVPVQQPKNMVVNSKYGNIDPDSIMNMEILETPKELKDLNHEEINIVNESDDDEDIYNDEERISREDAVDEEEYIKEKEKADIEKAIEKDKYYRNLEMEREQLARKVEKLERETQVQKLKKIKDEKKQLFKIPFLKDNNPNPMKKEELDNEKLW